MPNQDPTIGPFTQYLTEPVAPRPPQITGHEGVLGGVAQFASNFLQSASAKRRQNFEMQERQRAQNISALQSLMQIPEKVGMTPAAAQKFIGPVYQQLIGEVANADLGKGGDKKGGEHGFVKNLAASFLGPAAKQHKPLDPEMIGNAFTAAMDPNQFPRMTDVQKQLAQHSAEARNWLSDKINRGEMVTQADLLANPSLQKAKQLAEEHGVQYSGDTEMMRMLPASPIDAAIAANLRKPAQPPTPTQAAGQTTPVQQAEPPSPLQRLIETGSSGVAAPVQQAEPPRSSAIVPERDWQIAKMKGWVSKDPKNYIGTDGKVFLGRAYDNPLTGQSGIVNDDTREFVRGAKETGAAPQQKARASAEETEAARKSLTAQIDASGLDANQQSAARRVIEPFLSQGLTDQAITALSDHFKREADRQDRKADRESLLRLHNSLIVQRGSVGGISPAQNKQLNIEKRDYKSDPRFKDYISAVNLFPQAQAAFQRLQTTPNGVDDIELMRLAARMTHPKLALREEEFKNFKGAIGTLNSIGVHLSKGLFTGEQLTPQGRQYFMRMAQTAMQNHQKELEKLRVEKRATLSKYGIDESFMPELKGESEGDEPPRRKPTIEAPPKRF